MKQLFFSVAFLAMAMFASAQTYVQGYYRSNGTYVQGYSRNSSSSSISVPSYYSPNNISVQGYSKSNGTYVQPYYRTAPNSTNWDNYSTTPNINPYNGNQGYRAQDYTPQSYNYGSGQTIYTGSRGGQYYINSNGNKVYVPKH